MRDYLECQPYIRHLVAEHQRLQQELRAADRALTHGKETIGGKDANLAIETLEKIRDELVRHFHTEEDGGYMEEALSHCPQLAPEMQEILSEHPRLLAEIDQLIASAKDDRGTIKNRVLLRRDFDNFCRDLQAHERAENEVLRRSFGTNLGEQPLPPPGTSVRARTVQAADPQSKPAKRRSPR